MTAPLEQKPVSTPNSSTPNSTTPNSQSASLRRDFPGSWRLGVDSCRDSFRSPLRVAFIGAGQMARHHLATFGRLSAPAVTAGVHDRARDMAEEFAAIASARVCPSIEALLADTRPDVVHVCTPPAAHFDAAHAALDAGADVYVEKPFALTTAHARALLDVARERGRLVCAGHQLLRDRAFAALMARAPELGTLVQVDSHFAFRPVGRFARGGARALADQIIDILPHPLYSLVSVLERVSPDGIPIVIAGLDAGPTDLHVILRAGELAGRLSVSLRARPIASSLTLVGTGGTLTCDFVRSTVVGAANPGTEILEKIANPMLEGAQLLARTARSLPRRLRSGGGYPGLAELIDAFHASVRTRAASPVTPEHLLRVTALFETMVAEVDAAASRSQSSRVRASRPSTEPLTVVTGAHGFLGSRIVRSLERVRGIGRSPNSEDRDGIEWVVADLSRAVPPDALAGADVVVHAAAETAGAFDAHQRNTIDATRNLLHAMHARGVTKLVLVSSLSVLRPPRTPWECQDERTPRPADPRPLGSYVWGKSRQEELVEREAPALGISTRIVRPGALIDAQAPTLPGLMGRRLFGRWHLGLGRPALPIAACDVDRCAEAIAWCAAHFDEAPAVVNLFDPSMATRGTLAARLRERGWDGRMLWVPIRAVALGITAARACLSFARGQWPARLAAWSILRPRRFDPRVSAALLAAAAPDRRRAASPQPVRRSALFPVPECPSVAELHPDSSPIAGETT
jgi:predicted dehydrogenase/nucleoside-diphosphate-sugar epimerase